MPSKTYVVGFVQPTNNQIPTTWCGSLSNICYCDGLDIDALSQYLLNCVITATTKVDIDGTIVTVNSGNAFSLAGKLRLSGYFCDSSGNVLHSNPVSFTYEYKNFPFDFSRSGTDIFSFNDNLKIAFNNQEIAYKQDLRVEIIEFLADGIQKTPSDVSSFYMNRVKILSEDGLQVVGMNNGIATDLRGYTINGNTITIAPSNTSSIEPFDVTMSKGSTVSYNGLSVNFTGVTVNYGYTGSTATITLRTVNTSTNLSAPRQCDLYIFSSFYNVNDMIRIATVNNDAFRNGMGAYNPKTSSAVTASYTYASGTKRTISAGSQSTTVSVLNTQLTSTYSAIVDDIKPYFAITKGVMSGYTIYGDINAANEQYPFNINNKQISPTGGTRYVYAKKNDTSLYYKHVCNFRFYDPDEGMTAQSGDFKKMPANVHYLCDEEGLALGRIGNPTFKLNDTNETMTLTPYFKMYSAYFMQGNLSENNKKTLSIEDFTVSCDSLYTVDNKIPKYHPLEYTKNADGTYESKYKNWNIIKNYPCDGNYYIDVDNIKFTQVSCVETSTKNHFNVTNLVEVPFKKLNSYKYKIVNLHDMVNKIVADNFDYFYDEGGYDATTYYTLAEDLYSTIEKTISSSYTGHTSNFYYRYVQFGSYTGSTKNGTAQFHYAYPTFNSGSAIAFNYVQGIALKANSGTCYLIPTTVNSALYYYWVGNTNIQSSTTANVIYLIKSWGQVVQTGNLGTATFRTRGHVVSDRNTLTSDYYRGSISGQKYYYTTNTGSTYYDINSTLISACNYDGNFFPNYYTGNQNITVEEFLNANNDETYEKPHITINSCEPTLNETTGQWGVALDFDVRAPRYNNIQSIVFSSYYASGNVPNSTQQPSETKNYKCIFYTTVVGAFTGNTTGGLTVILTSGGTLTATTTTSIGINVPKKTTKCMDINFSTSAASTRDTVSNISITRYNGSYQSLYSGWYKTGGTAYSYIGRISFSGCTQMKYILKTSNYGFTSRGSDSYSITAVVRNPYRSGGYVNGTIAYVAKGSSNGIDLTSIGFNGTYIADTDQHVVKLIYFNNADVTKVYVDNVLKTTTSGNIIADSLWELRELDGQEENNMWINFLYGTSASAPSYGNKYTAISRFCVERWY